MFMYIIGILISFIIFILSIRISKFNGIYLDGVPMMGKAVMIIPKEVLKKLDLLKNNPKIKIDFDRITLVSSILIIIITIIFWNNLGLPDVLFESFLKIITFIGLIATLYQSWTGNDLFKFLRGDKSKNFSEVVC